MRKRRLGRVAGECSGTGQRTCAIDVAFNGIADGVYPGLKKTVSKIGNTAAIPVLTFMSSCDVVWYMRFPCLGVTISNAATSV